MLQGAYEPLVLLTLASIPASLFLPYCWGHMKKLTVCHMQPGCGILQRNTDYFPLTENVYRLHESLHTEDNLKIVTYLLTNIECFMVVRNINKEEIVIRKSLMRIPVNVTEGNSI